MSGKYAARRTIRLTRSSNGGQFGTRWRCMKIVIEFSTNKNPVFQVFHPYFFTATDAIEISISIKPTAKIVGERNITILNGTSVSITCMVVAKPAPRIIWHKETEVFLNHVVSKY